MLSCWGSIEEVLAYTYYFQSILALSCTNQSFGYDIEDLDAF
jgi:hypothetical protein